MGSVSSLPQFRGTQNRFSLGAIMGDFLLILEIKERTGFCRQGDGNNPSVLADVCFSSQLQSLVGCVFIQISRHLQTQGVFSASRGGHFLY